MVMSELIQMMYFEWSLVMSELIQMMDFEWSLDLTSTSGLECALG